MIQIEALEPVIEGRTRLEPGDRHTFDDETARRLCAHGWCKSVNGECETGERRVTRAVVEPAGTVHASAAANVGA